MKIASILFLLFTSLTYAQIAGCTDPLAKNFNPLTIVNDGSCEYRSTKIKSTYTASLSEKVKETSGLLLYDTLLWTHNDDHDTALYAVDTVGNIKKKIVLQNVKNTDWEEISQDSSYFYIGDFGNNVSGNRKDLHILRIEKKSLYSNIQKIDSISFSYSNQTDFSALKSNTTNFDCEWSSQKTSVYSLPKTTGKHIAQFQETINTKGLITGATYVPDRKTIVLCGYSKSLSPFIYLLYDFQDTQFASANKRKIKLQLPFHQVEGIATKDGIHYYISNESFTRKPFINSAQQLHQFDLSPFISQHLRQ
jgi:hypothetical protein